MNNQTTIEELKNRMSKVEAMIKEVIEQNKKLEELNKKWKKTDKI